MIKKELLNMHLLSATRKMAETAEQDEVKEIYGPWYRNYYGQKTRNTYRCHTYFMYLRAVVEGEVLKVSVFTRDRILNGQQSLYDIYINKKEGKYLTFDNEENKWRTAKIDMLDMGREDAWYFLPEQRIWQTAKDRELINRYLETGNNLEGREAILHYQNGRLKDYNFAKNRRETDAIDAVMREVPEVPKDFDAWIQKWGFAGKEYLFYERKGTRTEVYCTHCRKRVEIAEKLKHNTKAICSNCRQGVTCKAWNKQKYTSDEREIGLFQKLNDGTGYILRKFCVRRKGSSETGWENMEFTRHETVRVKLNNHMSREDSFEYGEYKYTGIQRWCHNTRRSRWYGMRMFREAVMYTRNLKRELRGTGLERLAMKKYMRGDRGKYIHPENILKNAMKYPCTEYLEKAGLTVLAEELLERGDAKGVDRNGKTLKEFLGLDKQRIRRLSTLNGSGYMVAALQEERRTGKRISDGNLERIECEHIEVTSLHGEKTGMSIEQEMNFLQRQQERNGWGFTEALRYYGDYLQMAEERGMDLTDEIVCRNNRMYEFHNKYLEERNRKKEEMRDREVDRKFPKIAADYEKNKGHFEYGTGELEILVPKKASEITREGRIQHHCVGASDRYMESMETRKSFILFLRKKERKDNPFYTLEVEWNGGIVQAYGAYDRKPEWDQVEKFLDGFTRKIKQRTRKELTPAAAATNKVMAAAAI